MSRPSFTPSSVLFVCIGLSLGVLGLASGMPPSVSPDPNPAMTPENAAIRRACIAGRGVYGLPQYHQHNRCIRKSVRLLGEGVPFLRAGFRSCDEFYWAHNRLYCFEALLAESRDPAVLEQAATCRSSRDREALYDCIEAILRGI